MQKIVYIILGLLLAAAYASAQTPTGLSEVGDEPVEFNAVKVLFYIVFPIAMMVAYILIRRIEKKRRKEELQGREDT